jgi:hypothetical protein
MSQEKTDLVVRIQVLCRSFPGLSNAPGVQPWEPTKLALWANEQLMVQGWADRSSAQFILSVWDNEYRWECGRFDIVFAMKYWRKAELAAFFAWAIEPWWAIK